MQITVLCDSKAENILHKRVAIFQKNCSKIVSSGHSLSYFLIVSLTSNVWLHYIFVTHIVREWIHDFFSTDELSYIVILLPTLTMFLCVTNILFVSSTATSETVLERNIWIHTFLFIGVESLLSTGGWAIQTAVLREGSKAGTLNYFELGTENFKVILTASNFICTEQRKRKKLFG